MLLTPDEIDRICKDVEYCRVKRDKIQIIKRVRDAMYMGLREARDYVESNWDNLVPVLRKDLEERAGINCSGSGPRQIIENCYFRLEVKRGDVTFEKMSEFFAEVAEALRGRAAQ